MLFTSSICAGWHNANHPLFKVLSELVSFFWTKFRTKEELADNSWRLLVAVILLNKTCGKAAIPVFWSVMKDWPTPYHLSQG